MKPTANRPIYNEFLASYTQFHFILLYLILLAKLCDFELKCQKTRQTQISLDFTTPNCGIKVHVAESVYNLILNAFSKHAFHARW